MQKIHPIGQIHMQNPLAYQTLAHCPDTIEKLQLIAIWVNLGAQAIKQYNYTQKAA